MRAPSWPERARPSFHFAASAAANASGVRLARRAASASIHGRKSAGESAGNASRRVARSPFGALTSAEGRAS